MDTHDSSQSGRGNTALISRRQRSLSSTDHLDPSCLRIVATYFSSDERKTDLDAGQKLLESGIVNERLYYVQRGRIRGSMIPDSGDEEVPLVILPGDLAGLQSFFIAPHKSRATLIAEVPTTLYWVDHSCFDKDLVAERELMPLLTHTMTRRQHLVQVLQEEQHRLLQQAAQVERFELLGQFSAGVAHELNNALAVVEQSSSFIAKNLNLQLIRPELAEELNHLAENGLPTISNPLPSTVRRFATAEKLSPTQAGRILRFDFPEKTAKKIAKIVRKKGESVLNDCDIAAALHDGTIAAQQAAAVVASMRSLGARKHAEPTTFDLRDTIERAQVILRSVLKDITVDIEADASPILGQPGVWVQIWSNLFKNAADALHSAGTEAPRIHVSIRHRDTHYTMQVTDNGPGIPAELQHQVFLPNVTTKKDGLAFGLGLGLPTVRRIVSEYGGIIAAGDNPNGPGTQMTIRIPKKPDVSATH